VTVTDPTRRLRAEGRDEVADPPSRIADALLGSIDKVVDQRWAVALANAGAARGTTEERVRELRSSFSRELAMAGAAAGAVAAAPGVGTAASIGAAAGELGWVTMRSADLILAVAAAHGHTQASVEQRRAWVLSILVFGNTASQAFTKLAGELGNGLGKQATKKVSTQMLRQINATLGRTIVTKYGTKRGAIALGRALPFGFGAVIGGGANYATVRVLTGQADAFFRNLPDGLIALPEGSAGD